jgi:hypothetical protein
MLDPSGWQEEGLLQDQIRDQGDPGRTVLTSMRVQKRERRAEAYLLMVEQQKALQQANAQWPRIAEAYEGTVRKLQAIIKIVEYFTRFASTWAYDFLEIERLEGAMVNTLMRITNVEVRPQNEAGAVATYFSRTDTMRFSVEPDNDRLSAVTIVHETMHAGVRALLGHNPMVALGVPANERVTYYTDDVIGSALPRLATFESKVLDNDIEEALIDWRILQEAQKEFGHRVVRDDQNRRVDYGYPNEATHALIQRVTGVDLGSRMSELPVQYRRLDQGTGRRRWTRASDGR